MDQDLKNFINELKALGVEPQVVINVPFSLDETPPTLPENPPPATLVKYTVDASSKKSKNVKLRNSPSPVADGPTVAHGATVFYTGHQQTYMKVVYMQVKTTDANPLMGWVEAEYLKLKA